MQLLQQLQDAVVCGPECHVVAAAVVAVVAAAAVVVVVDDDVAFEPNYAPADVASDGEAQLWAGTMSHQLDSECSEETPGT